MSLYSKHFLQNIGGENTSDTGPIGLLFIFHYLHFSSIVHSRGCVMVTSWIL